MVDWTLVGEFNPVKIREAAEVGPDPLHLYKERYINDLAEDSKKNFDRYNREIFCELDADSSVLLFGSGHPFHANATLERCPNVSKVSVLDYIEEAGLGLNDSIDFYCEDIRHAVLPVVDYVFSAHTVEHFNREDILETVLPRLLAAARKAVIFAVPYGENWGLEPSHLCRFYEDDEMTAQSEKYKRILDNPDHNAYGQELILWFKGENGG